MLIFAMLLCHLKFENLKPGNFKTFTLIFRCFSLPSELDISNFIISNVGISHITLSRSLLIIKNEMGNFKKRNVPSSNTKNVAISNMKNEPISNTGKCPFQIRKSGIFKKEKCVIFKYEKCVHFKYENVPF